MHARRIDEADALALRVCKVITRHNTKWLRDIDAKKNAKDAWAKIREITRSTSRENWQSVSGITAQILNEHYSAISTDMSYRPTQVRLTAAPREVYVFRLLDTLKRTATRLDDIPA